MGQFRQQSQHGSASCSGSATPWQAAVRLALALVLLLSPGPSSAGLAAAATAAGTQTLRSRKHTLEDSLGRRLLLSCGQCPPASDAQAACNALPESERTNIRNKLISGCGSALMSAGVGAGGCCSSLPQPGTPDWTNWVACMCYGGDGLTGLSAYVNPQDVLNACGCGAQQPQQAAAPPTDSAAAAAGGLSLGRSSFTSTSTSTTGSGSAALTSSYTGGTGGKNPADIVNEVLGGNVGPAPTGPPSPSTPPASTGPQG